MGEWLWMVPSALLGLVLIRLSFAMAEIERLRDNQAHLLKAMRDTKDNDDG